MLKTFCWQLSAAAILMRCLSQVAQAQTAFGSRSFGSGVQSNSTGGSSNFGQGYNTGAAGLGGSGYGTGGSNSQMPTSYGNGMTNNANGQTGSGASGMQSQAGQVQSNARYLQQNRQGAFVGADRGDTTAFGSQQAATAQNRAMQSQTQFFNQISQQMQRNNQMLNQQNRGGQQKQQVRVSIKLGFTPKAAGVAHSTAATTKLQTRLTKLPNLPMKSPVKVTLEEGEVVLRGTVATESDRELVEGLAMMEPGIEAVRNELVVDPGATTAAE